MSDKRQIRKYRFFSIADFEEEQQFLRKQHQQGYRFIRYTAPCSYLFEKCVPEDMVYQLDFSTVEDQNKEDYLQIFKDCGWEYLMDACGWSYFRKPASLTNGNEEIFSDIESKIDLMRRVFKKRMIPLLIYFFCCLVPQICIQVSWIVEGKDVSLFSVFLVSMFVTLFVLFSSLMISFARKLYKLKKRYGYW